MAKTTAPAGKSSLHVTYTAGSAEQLQKILLRKAKERTGRDEFKVMVLAQDAAEAAKFASAGVFAVTLQSGQRLSDWAKGLVRQAPDTFILTRMPETEEQAAGDAEALVRTLVEAGVYVISGRVQPARRTAADMLLSEAHDDHGRSDRIVVGAVEHEDKPVHVSLLSSVLSCLRPKPSRRLVPLFSRPHESVLVFAPCASGKTSSVVVPTLLTNAVTAVVHDVQKELFTLTSGARQKLFGHDIHCFEPMALDSPTHINLLDWVRWGRSATELELRRLGRSLFTACKVPVEALEFLTHWFAQSAAAARAQNPRAGLADAFAELHSDGGTALALLAVEAGVTADAAAQMAKQVGLLVDRLCDPVVRSNTTSTTLGVEQLLHGNVATLYLVAPPTCTEQGGPLFAAILELLAYRTTEVLQFVSGEPVAACQPLLFVLDEAAQLGPLEALARVAPYARSHALSLLWLFQDSAKMRQSLGNEGADCVARACPIRIDMTPNDIASARELALRCSELGMSAKDLLCLPERAIVLMRLGVPASVVQKYSYFNDRALATLVEMAPAQG